MTVLRVLTAAAVVAANSREQTRKLCLKKMVFSIFAIVSADPQRTRFHPVDCVCSAVTQKPAALTHVWQCTNKRVCVNGANTHIHILSDGVRQDPGVGSWFSGSWVLLALIALTSGHLGVKPNKSLNMSFFVNANTLTLSNSC